MAFKELDMGLIIIDNAFILRSKDLAVFYWGIL
jgi:hypothetical protein